MGWLWVGTALAADLIAPGATGDRTFRSSPVDLALAVGLTAAAVGAPLLPADPPGLAPGAAGLGDVLADGPFDYTVHAPSAGWSRASDWLAIGVASTPLWLPHEGGRRADGWFGRATGRAEIGVEAVATTLLVVEAGKRGFDRPRPWTRLDPSLWPAGRDLDAPDAAMSLPSGHTAATAAGAMSAATIAWLSRPGPTRWTHYAGFGAAAAVTATVGVARVRANMHWPTDTLAGGALGAALGVGIPLLHTVPGARVAPMSERLGLTFTVDPR